MCSSSCSLHRLTYSRRRARSVLTRLLALFLNSSQSFRAAGIFRRPFSATAAAQSARPCSSCARCCSSCAEMSAAKRRDSSSSHSWAAMASSHSSFQSSRSCRSCQSSHSCLSCCDSRSQSSSQPVAESQCQSECGASTLPGFLLPAVLLAAGMLIPRASDSQAC